MRRSPLRRAAAIRRQKALTRRAIQRRRAQVTTEERHAKSVVRTRSGGVCEGCGKRRAAEWSHRVNASQGGPWHPTNGLHLCLWCHDWLHDNILAARALGWSLQRHQDPAAEPVTHAQFGRVFLNNDGTTTRQENAA